MVHPSLYPSTTKNNNLQDILSILQVQWPVQPLFLISCQRENHNIAAQVIDRLVFRWLPLLSVLLDFTVYIRIVSEKKVTGNWEIPSQFRDRLEITNDSHFTVFSWLRRRDERGHTLKYMKEFPDVWRHVLAHAVCALRAGIATGSSLDHDNHYNFAFSSVHIS